MNEIYKMPAMPPNVEEGILKGMYKFRAADNKRAKIKAHLFGSGTILNEALKAQALLENDYGVAADVWSVTSYKNLYWDATDTERWNFLHPDREPKLSYLQQQLVNEKGVFITASDYLKALPGSIAKWLPGPTVLLGTDGYGRSETRDCLRDFFEVDARHIAYAPHSYLAHGDLLSISYYQISRGQTCSSSMLGLLAGIILIPIALFTFIRTARTIRECWSIA